MSKLEIKTWRNNLKFEQMAHEKAKGQQAEKLFLGSLLASRAIKKLALNGNELDLCLKIMKKN